MKVFLGGTVNNSKWRDKLIPLLKVAYYNPVVTDWTEEVQKRELEERKNCDYCLYVLTPLMTGYYSIAEVVDDSYKRPDRTILCYIVTDAEKKFSEQQIQDLENLRKIVENNGGLFIDSLENIADFFNSAYIREKNKTHDFKDVFISYGRRHSLDFAKKLYNKLTEKGKNVWFDMNNIPLGVDFQEQIDDGILKADNFIYIISPHSVKSEYCLKEVVLALKYNKRIIPILHIEPSDCWDKMHMEIARRNWVYIRQQADDNIPRPEWKEIDIFDEQFPKLLQLLDLHKNYTKDHTYILGRASEWQKKQCLTSYLLNGLERINAEKWILKKDFVNEKGVALQPPCLPTDLHAEYICESEKYAKNLFTDAFISYTKENKEHKLKITNALMHQTITVWMHEHDIDKGEDFEKAVERGIMQADNFIYIISNETVNSELATKELELAITFNKPIIPVVIQKVDDKLLHKEIKHLQAFDFSSCLNEEQEKSTDKQTIENLSQVERINQDVEKRRGKTPFEKCIAELINEINDDAEYYHMHTKILVQAKKWKARNENICFLLHGYELENAKVWLESSINKQHKPTQIHQDFIQESKDKAAIIVPEIFISYVADDIDFVNKLNIELQNADKITWADKQYFPQNIDNTEIKKAIEKSLNVALIYSANSHSAKECTEEIEYAKILNKRIIVLKLENLENNQNQLLDKTTILDFDPKFFNQNFQNLLNLLNIDREYVREHSKYSQLAIEWENKSKSKDQLLRGNQFAVAYDWLQDSIHAEKQPEPTTLIKEFIEGSHQNIERESRITKRNQMIMRILTILAIIGVFVSLYFMTTTQTLMEETKEKEKNMQALYMASVAKDAMQESSIASLQLVYNAYLINNQNTHPYIKEAITKVFNYFILDKRAIYQKEFTIGTNMFWANYTEDGQKIFTYSDDSIKLYDAKNYNIISEFAMDIWDAEISPDGNNFVVYNQDSINTLRFLDQKGNIIKKYDYKDRRWDFIFFNQQKVMTFAYTNLLDIYDYKGNIINQLKLGDSIIYELVFDKQDEMLLTLNDAKDLIIWNLQGDTTGIIKQYGDYFVNYNENCNLILNQNKRNITVYDYSAKLKYKFKIDFEPRFVRISDDGKLVFFQKFDNNILVYNDKGKKIAQTNFDKIISKIVFNDKSDEILIISESTVFFKWSIIDNNLIYFVGHSEELIDLDYLPNQKAIISCSLDKSAKVWDTNGGLQVSIEGHDSEILNCSFSEDNLNILTYSFDQTAKLWNISSMESLKFTGHHKEITNLITSHDKKILVSQSDDNTIKMWDTLGNLLEDYKFTDDSYQAIFSEDDKLYAMVNYEKAYIYDNTRKLISTANYAKYEPKVFLFANSGKYFLTVNTDKSIYIWEIYGNIKTKIPKFKDEIKKVLFAKNDRFYVWLDNNKIEEYEIDGELKNVFYDNDLLIKDIQIHRNSIKILAVEKNSNDYEVLEFDEETLFNIKNIKGNIKSAEFTDNNDVIFLNTDDNMAYLIDKEGEIITSFYENTADIFSVSVAENKDKIIISYIDRRAKIIDISTNSQNQEKIMTENIVFGYNNVIYYTIDYSIKTFYSFDYALQWLKNNNLPPLSEKDKVKYGIIEEKIIEKVLDKIN